MQELIKRKLKKVYVLEPTGNPERPFEVKRYVNATQDNIFDALARSRLGILGLVPRSDLPDNLATVDFGDLDIPPLGDLDLEHGAEYVALCNWHLKVEQVGTYFTHATIDTVGVHGACCLLAYCNMLRVLTCSIPVYMLCCTLVFGSTSVVLWSST